MFKKRHAWMLILGFAFFGIAWTASAKEAQAADMYRLYNPNSGEHFYTSNGGEKSNLVGLGWNDEGLGWIAPDSGAPVYRLYNANVGDHHYTLNASERDFLIGQGWNDEGVCWYSSSEGSIPLYRVYNPNSKTATHHYTTDVNEFRQLVAIGWKDEGISWYGTGYGMNREQLASKEICDYVNLLRASLGESPLNYNGTLVQIAQIRSNELPYTFDHNRPDGSSYSTAYDQMGYRWYWCGENIAYTSGYGNISSEDLAYEFFSMWYNSPGHYGNMIDTDYEEIGIAITKSGNTFYATQNFGTPW